jgi:FkbM family methyltransferase
MRAWTLDSRASLRFRIAFVLSCVPVLLTKKVYFLGDWFYSDNAIGLLTLPEYVPLVLDVYEKMGQPENLNLLDVGANVGQFGYTWLKLLGGECLSVEPNSSIYPYLESNMCSLNLVSKKWTLLESGCGPTFETKILYYVQNKSAQGSLNIDFAKSNLLSSNNMQSISTLFQPITPKLLHSMGISKVVFNIVKIDVEGNEVSAIQGLSNLQFNYALIEVGESRGVGSTFSEIMHQLEQTTRQKVTHVYSDNPLGNGTILNALFKIG